MRLAEDEAVRVWHSRLGSSFSDAYRIFKRFYDESLIEHMVFGGMTPSELVDWQVNARGRDAFKLKELAQQWINEHGWRYSTKQTRLSQIASFFLHNHAPWPPDPSFHFTSDTPPVDGKLNFNNFRRIILNSNKLYRAVFLMMAAGFMGEKELIYVNKKYSREVLQHITKNDGEFKLVLPGRKRNRNIKNFYTILSTKSDWADAYRDYMKSDISDPLRVGFLFRNNREQPLTRYNIQYYFHCRAVEAGVVKDFSPPCQTCQSETVRFRNSGKVGYRCRSCGTVNWASSFDSRFTDARYGVNPHEIRDLMRSRWQVSGADPLVAEFMMGHEIDPNAYNKFMKYEPWYPVQEYREASPWLNVLTEDPEKISRFDVNAELETYRTENQDLRRKLSQVNERLETLEDQVEKRLDEIDKKAKQWTESME